jgi:uncharacterized membrane protein
MHKTDWLVVSLCLLGGMFSPWSAGAQEQSPSALDENGKIVDFQRDVAPLLVSRCLECHAGEKAKADFLVTDRDAVLGFITPEDPASSSLYTDYLTTTDPDMLMPPGTHHGPLPASELALIRLWIEEGAQWPDDATVAAAGEAVDVAPAPATVSPNNSLPARIWDFQGYFHPATVHFPVALLTVGGLFVVIGLVFPKIGTQIPFACLLLGSGSAVVACLMGWSLADVKGYQSYTAGWGAEVNAHRWSAIILAVLGVVLSVIAIKGVRSESRSLGLVWKTGLLALAVTVGLVGHQGGELTYGKNFYPKAFERLLGTTEAAPSVAETPSSETPAAEEPAPTEETTTE